MNITLNRTKLTSGVKLYVAVVISYTILRIPLGIFAILCLLPKGGHETIGRAMRYADTVFYMPFVLGREFVGLFEREEWFSYAMIGYYVAVVAIFVLLMVFGVFRWVWTTIREITGSR